jgi:DnaJ-class molecular chaperone
LFIFRPGYNKVVPDEGMPISNNPEDKGSLVIQFDINYPNHLSPEQKRLLKEALL